MSAIVCDAMRLSQAHPTALLNIFSRLRGGSLQLVFLINEQSRQPFLSGAPFSIMVFSIAKEQRDDLVDRMADSLAAIGFHNYGQTFTDTRAKAEEIEARAFSVAEVASSTTKVMVRRDRQSVR